MINFEIETKLIKEVKADKIQIFDETKNQFYMFCASDKNVCIRKDGDVILDVNWDKNTDRRQKSHLKKFLGGMYIQEVRKEIVAGIFHVRDLNM